MRRARNTVILAASLCAFAAVSREAYRDAYKAWRQADPTLERDVAAAGPALAAEIDRVANQAIKYAAARSVFLSQSAAEQERRLAFLNQDLLAAPPAGSDASRIVSAEADAVRHSLDVYGKDPDRGIQMARALLNRENIALGALAPLLAEARKTADQARAATESEQQARKKALGLLREASAMTNQQIAKASQEGAAWADYYRLLADAVRGATPASVTPAAAPAPDPRAPSSALPALPLSRYVGAWVFPAVNGLYHGPEPEFVDLVVHEQNGHADGSLFARFKVSGGDPLIRFDFAGDFQKTRNQVFNLETSDGAKGTIELIPGPAFNLLEINVQIEPKPGRIHQANAVLIKK
ncbi:MAG TPA: hypothetical protein VKX39_08215 [Bryobacteraceae bacterium]|jgi:hypothetical protein|nr:hypothetical protein [Bryobacteraceae bacterium]